VSDSSSLSPILPVLERRAEIEAAIRAHQVVVLCGQTGSGKTTQLPQICLDLGRKRIAHTQPRRLAARAVAARIAEERGVQLGGIVGVKVRFHDQTTRDTAIKVMTDGVLLAELAGDPLLGRYDTIIIDEAHERSLNIDFLLGCFQSILPSRPDLRLIITSATIDTNRFSAAFGGPTRAPVIEVSGRMYPVEVRYRPGRDEEGGEVEIEAVADAVEELARPSSPPGDVLVFLPGEREIRLADGAIKRRGISAEVLPLFSRLSNQEQDRIFHPSGAARRIILATNVAETSLTVPGIRYVVDAGLARINRYDPQRKIAALPIEPISRASADQRAGRCGRVAAGVCIRLYSEDSYRARPTFTDPEIRRTSLASVILQMKSLAGAGGGALGAVETFPFLDPPEPLAIKDGYETLFELGALDAPGPEGNLTDIGRDMARVPLDPRIGRMLLAAEREGALNEAIILAAALEIQDPRQRPMGRQDDADRAQQVFRHETSDFLTLLKIWDQYLHAADTMSHGPLTSWCHEHFLAPNRMREWVEMVGQLRRVAKDLELRQNHVSATADAIHKSLLTGLISNVACREGDGSFDYRGVRGNVVQIFPGSALFKKGPKWIMAAEIVQTTRLYARTVARIEPEWVEQLAGHMFRRQLSDKHLDAETGEPSAWERVTMSGIVVVPRRRTALAPVDPSGARELFIREGLVRGKWATDAPFMQRNRATIEQARTAEAKLRRRGLIVDDDALVAWFDRRIPKNIAEPIAFESWRAKAESTNSNLLVLQLHEVVKPDARAAADPTSFPDHLTLDSGSLSQTEGAEGRSPAASDHLHHQVESESALPSTFHCVLTYALAPGKDEDGITLTIPLTELPRLTGSRAEWLIPGLLPELVQALIKALPKSYRAALEAKAPIDEVGEACASLMTFGEGTLELALSETLEVLHGVKVAPEHWTFKALPAHLRLRIRIIDDHGKDLAASRDLPELAERFAGRIRKAQAARARAHFARSGITTWDFGNLSDRIELANDGEIERFPAIIDDTTSVSLTLADSADFASRLTHAGLRRLFALACREELDHHLASLPQWSEITRHYGALGSAEQLRSELAALIAERTFIAGQSPVRTKDTFDTRLAECWGRLATVAREVAEIVAGTLEPRAKVAHRLSGGTPRLWAASIADIREHAAYLMPRGFLLLAPWERLRHYPRYAEAMRARLLSLREDGSGVETAALAKFSPHWKKFTGWVAGAMSRERGGVEEMESAEVKAGGKDVKARTKAPLPQARRAAPTVNLDAGEWAMQPGKLPAAMEKYRWMLEELRVGVFAGEGSVTVAAVEVAWKKAQG